MNYASTFERMLTGKEVEEGDTCCPDVSLPTSHDLLGLVRVDHLRRHEEVSPFRSTSQEIIRALKEFTDAEIGEEHAAVFV